MIVKCKEHGNKPGILIEPVLLKYKCEDCYKFEQEINKIIEKYKELFEALKEIEEKEKNLNNKYGN